MARVVVVSAVVVIVVIATALASSVTKEPCTWSGNWFHTGGHREKAPVPKPRPIWEKTSAAASESICTVSCTYWPDKPESLRASFN